VGQGARCLTACNFLALHVVADIVDHLWVGERRDVAEVGEVRHRSDDPAYDLAGSGLGLSGTIHTFLGRPILPILPISRSMAAMTLSSMSLLGLCRT
jgi:hypothetical protein